MPKGLLFIVPRGARTKKVFNFVTIFKESHFESEIEFLGAFFRKEEPKSFAPKGSLKGNTKFFKIRSL